MANRDLDGASTTHRPNKVIPLRQAIADHVHAGDVVHAAYTGARPSAPLFELARRFAGKDPGLTLTGTGLAGPQTCLVELGVLRHVVASFIGENYPVARPSPAFQRALADGRVTMENWSLWTLIARLVAGGLGVPFMPVRGIQATTMAEDLAASGYVRVPDPFRGEDDPDATVGVVSALRPDVVLMQAVAADRFGNVVLAPPYGEAHWGALAAQRGVIACVERVIETEEIQALAPLGGIPAHLVLAVCETPMGAHPYSLFNPGVAEVQGYAEDRAAMIESAEAARTADGFRGWIDEWVLEPGSHEQYLAKLGAQRRRSLCHQAAPGYWREQQKAATPPSGPASRAETHVVAAGRYVAQRVADGGYEAILAGVGQANLAAWLGADVARRGGRHVELMAEIGMIGYTPRPGEPFVFAHRNYFTSNQLADSMTVLGALVSGPRTRSMGVFGAGQVDGEGNVNSTYMDDGRFIVGSGGASDIAAGADEVIVVTTHHPRRLRAALPYITSSGRHVRAVATDLAIYEITPAGPVLVRLLPAAGTDTDEAIALLREQTGWDFTVSDDLVWEPEPTASELELLRSFDPRGDFIGK